MSRDNPQPNLGRIKVWAKNSAADYVSKYATSKANLERVLKRRFKRKYPDIDEALVLEIVADTSQFFVDNKMIDDSSFAETKALSGARKGHSARRVAATLTAKGVDPETISETLTDFDDLAAALRFARKRRIGPFRREGGDIEREQKAKEYASMGRGGFSSQTVREAFSLSREDAEERLLGDTVSSSGPLLSYDS